MQVITEYLFFPDMQGMRYRVVLPPYLEFSGSKFGELPDRSIPLAYALYDYQGRLEKGLFVYKFAGVICE